MKRAVRCLLPVILCGILAAGPGVASKSGTPAKQPPVPDPAKTAAAVAQAPEVQPEAKVVHYGEKDVVKVKTKLRYSTLIVLPKSEQILDFTCGDKEFWVIDGTPNLAHIKPAKEGAETNLNLITASGNIYSFMLAEGSETPNAQADVKIFVEFEGE